MARKGEFEAWYDASLTGFGAWRKKERGSGAEMKAAEEVGGGGSGRGFEWVERVRVWEVWSLGRGPPVGTTTSHPLVWFAVSALAFIRLSPGTCC